MPALAQMKCKPLPAGTPALTRARIDALLKEVPGWSYDGKVIAKTWSFKNYYETVAFVNAVAWIVHREDHHPDIDIRYTKVTMTHVPYKGGPPALTDLLGGQIDLMFELIPNTIPHIRSGRVRALKKNAMRPGGQRRASRCRGDWLLGAVIDDHHVVNREPRIII